MPFERQQKRQQLVLIGAGYAHLQAVRLLSQRHPFESITLIDVQPFANYCGMIPGYLAKLYPDEYEECRIDLTELCSKDDKIHFIHDGVLDIDFQRQLVYLVERSMPLEFDIISLDIGSATKSLDDVPGAFAYTIPTRPIHDLVDRLERAELDFKEKKVIPPVRLVVVGGGATGFELATSLVGRWRPLLGKSHFHVTLITSEKTLLPENPSARRALKEVLVEKGITLCFNSTVVKVDDHFVHLKCGMKVPYNYCLWATGAGCHDLARTLEQRGLDVTNDGWFRVSDTLQSTSHPNVFAAGDCCYSSSLALPKAGIYSLQEGPVLAQNLRQFALDQPLEKFHPDENCCLQFLSCGDGTALGFAFGMPMRGRWVWQIKHAMDDEFLSLFTSRKQSTGTKHTNTTFFTASKRLPPSEAAALLLEINMENYRQAWAVLKEMADHDDYRSQVLKLYARKKGHRNGKNNNKDDNNTENNENDPSMVMIPASK